MLNSQECKLIFYQVGVLVKLTCVCFDWFLYEFLLLPVWIRKRYLVYHPLLYLSLSLSLLSSVYVRTPFSAVSESLSSCLHTQVVSVAEYHRRIDALNTEELRTLCRRLQVPLLRSKLPQSDHALLLVSFLKTNLTLDEFVLNEALK